ncbi:hypothetical protein KSP40_PGU010967 [Platanthera guangdongensis]|uniref:Arogenate dehydratase n=1 Tax=Platanthera guangdongensis TaxID=2320717 RepID=A0ABR2LFX6_9ASPA
MASMAGTRIITIEPRSQIAKGTRSGSRIPVWIPLRRRRDTFVMASVGGDPGVSGNGSNDNARALELKMHVNESSQEITFKDSSTLPILPIENSLGGSIHRNYDLLLRYSLHIVGEVKYAVRHCLLANHGVKIGDLKRVLSHPQALAQCEHTLTKMGVVREAVDDTAGAAKFVATNQLQDAGAVASSFAAEIYDLNILARDIQDDSDNVTRFLMLAREPIIPGIDRPFKTSIVFSLEEGPGMLFKALAVFALRDINLTKIESRPQRKKLARVYDYGSIGSPKLLIASLLLLSRFFDYLFYVDFEASMASQNAQNALRHLEDRNQRRGFNEMRKLVGANTRKCIGFLQENENHIWNASSVEFLGLEMAKARDELKTLGMLAPEQRSI